MKPEISATMAEALALAHEHGGRLVRYVGGHWSYEDAPLDQRGNPVEKFGAAIVAGLVKRGYLKYSDWKDGRSYRFPVAVTLT